MTPRQLDQFLNISIALSAQRDRTELLTYILDTAMDMVNCDGSTLYLREEDGLHFSRMVTRSFGIRQGGHEVPITLPPVPLKPSHVCARAILENRLINVEDVQNDENFDFSGAKRYDAMTGYCTRSMLVLPLADDKGNLIGVLQLINALDEEGKTVCFPEEIQPLISAVASQAAISLTNIQYGEQIHKLLGSLVGTLSTAIDQRTPYNANHTRNMAKYAQRFLDWLEEKGHPRAFEAERRRAFLMSVWLHDVGKLVVSLSVMDKESRLGAREKELEHRFSTMELLERIAVLEGRRTPQEALEEQKKRQDAWQLIQRVNKQGFLPDEDLEAIRALGSEVYTTLDGRENPWLTPEELEALSVRKGTLADQERKIMESHVTMTARILEQVSFPREYSQVPKWAAAHHELLHGRGYPNGWSGEQLCEEVRLLTILDIFDALTALDRPYKPGMPVERAVQILESMVREGALDGELLTLFCRSRAWEEKEEQT